MEDGETKNVLRRVQMYIDEDPGNRLLNKSKTILIWILRNVPLFLFRQLRYIEYLTILNIYRNWYVKN